MLPCNTYLTLIKLTFKFFSLYNYLVLYNVIVNMYGTIAKRVIFRNDESEFQYNAPYAVM